MIFSGKEKDVMGKAGKNSSISIILLAAGESVRTKTPKMLLPLQDKTLIEKVIENLQSSRIKNTVVVLGAWKDEIMEKIGNLPVRITFNEEWKKGMLSSVIKGIRSLPADTSAAIIYPADYPFIAGKLLDEITEAYFKSGKGIVVPVCKGRRGHPVLIDRKYFGEIERLDYERGLRLLLEKFSSDIFEHPTDDENIFFDIDTMEDYVKATKK